MTRWEYLFVTAEWDGEWRVRWKNEAEIKDWKSGPNLFASVAELGDGGWELVSTPDWPGGPDSHARRLVFKRPKE
jgi:hypothetical protein